MGRFLDLVGSSAAARRTAFAASVLLATGWNPAKAKNLQFLYMSPGPEGSLASIADGSDQRRTLTVPGAASARPQAFQRNWAMRGNPVIGFNSLASQWAQDQAGDAAAFAAKFHQPGVVVAVRCQIFGDGQIVGNWDLGTSNQNAFSVRATGTGIGPNGQLFITVTSVAGGGTTHINTSTAAGFIRPGDVVTIWLIHNADRTWSAKFIREDQPGRAGATTTTSGTSLAGANAGNAAHGITLGARGDVATFCPVRIYAAWGAVAGANSAADVAAFEQFCTSNTSFPMIAYDVDSPILRANMGDGTHGNTTYHSQCGVALATMENLNAVARGWGTSTRKVACGGDSRMAGGAIAGITLGTNDMRSIAAAQARTWTRTPYGPIDDGAGNNASKFHFARSGYVSRTNTLSSGHSQRTPSATTIDNYWGPGKAFNDADAIDWFLGVNEFSRPWEFDYVDELARMFEYQIESALAAGRPAPCINLLNNPITGATTNGAAQYYPRAYNREYMAMVPWMRQFTDVRLANINDTTDNP